MFSSRPPALTRPGRWRLRVRVPAALAAGLLATLAFPPLDRGAFAFVALVPLLVALRGASARDGAVAGAAFGLAFMGVLAGWLSLVGWIAWAALVFAQTLFYAAFGALAALAGRRGAWLRVLAWPLLYAGVELARARYPLGGFAWGLLGTSQHAGGPLLPLARLGGVIAITVALVAVNALLAEAVADRRRRRALPALAVAAAIGVAPAALPLGAVAGAGSLDVAVVQGNVPRGVFTDLRRGRGGPEDEVIIDNHLRLTRTLAAQPPDLVVWPENALDRDPFNDPVAHDAVAEALRLTGAPLLVGAIVDGPDPKHFYNSNLYFEPDGALAGRYDKLHLVPFGEYVPWSWARRVVPALEQVPTDGIPGRVPVVFDHAAGVRIGAVICFESSYPWLVRRFVRAGAEILVVSTNNATFGRSPLARQHLALSRLRAVETGRPVVHAAISGISAVIRPDGRIVREAGLFLPAVVRERVQAATGRTPYVAYGDWIDAGYGIGAAIAAVAACALAVRRRAPRVPVGPAAPADDAEPDEFWTPAAPPLEPLRADGGEDAPP